VDTSISGHEATTHEESVLVPNPNFPQKFVYDPPSPLSCFYYYLLRAAKEQLEKSGTFIVF
jgi:hypothetical protein